MANFSKENTLSGYLIDNPLYFTDLDANGVDTYQLPTSSNEREDRDRDEEQAKQMGFSHGFQSNVLEEGILSKMQTLEVSAQSNSSVQVRPLLQRPPPERVGFNQDALANPFSFAIQAGRSLEGTDWDQESIYDEANPLALTDELSRAEYVGPSHNPAEINSYFQVRAGELVGLADPQTIDAIPEQELFALLSAAMASLRSRRSVFW